MASHPFTIATLPKHEEWMRTYRTRGGTFSDVVRSAISLASQKRLDVIETPNPSDGTDSSVRLDAATVEQLDAVRGLAPRLTFLRAVAAAYMDAHPPEPVGWPAWAYSASTEPEPAEPGSPAEPASVPAPESEPSQEE